MKRQVETLKELVREAAYVVDVDAVARAIVEKLLLVSRNSLHERSGHRPADVPRM